MLPTTFSALHAMQPSRSTVAANLSETTGRKGHELEQRADQSPQRNGPSARDVFHALGAPI